MRVARLVLLLREAFVPLAILENKLLASSVRVLQPGLTHFLSYRAPTPNYDIELTDLLNTSVWKAKD